MHAKPTYLSRFGLTEEPFSASPNPRFFYTSPLHDIALQKTRFVVSAKKGLCVVFGDTGTGKTTLARLLYFQFVEDGFITGLLTNPAYPTPNQLLRVIMKAFDYPNFGRSYQATLDRFQEFLYVKALEEEKTVVLIVDEAQTLKPTMLEFLRQLLNFETNDQKLLQLVLFSQNELRAKLKRAQNLENRISLKASLESLTLPESEQMLRHRWQVAGGQSFPFTPQALDALYHFSGGVPRRQVILADNVLLSAGLLEQTTIDDGLVTQVAQDQEFTPTTTTEAP